MNEERIQEILGNACEWANSKRSAPQPFGKIVVRSYTAQFKDVTDRNVPIYSDRLLTLVAILLEADCINDPDLEDT